MDAELFSQPIDNSIGYSPRHPQPPGYIKIRSKFKKEREFDRVFLSQELRTNIPSAQDERPSTSSGVSVRNNTANARTSSVNEKPVWALEFSKDGKYLAAGGQDGVVRVWTVISSPDERTAHEIAEAGTQKDGQQPLHLNAPVFQKKTFREYTGHESTILDLSWSKVRKRCHVP